jgi:hypothetical protein
MEKLASRSPGLRRDQALGGHHDPGPPAPLDRLDPARALTGSLPDKPADKAKPPAIEGWVLRDVYDGMAMMIRPLVVTTTQVRPRRSIASIRPAPGSVSPGPTSRAGPDRQPSRQAGRQGQAAGHRGLGAARRL